MQALVQLTYSGQVGSRWVGYGSNLKKVSVYANAADINIRFLGIFYTVKIDIQDFLESDGQ